MQLASCAADILELLKQALQLCSAQVLSLVLLLPPRGALGLLQLELMGMRQKQKTMKGLERLNCHSAAAAAAMWMGRRRWGS